MNAPVDLALFLAEIAFWVTIEAGVYSGTLRKPIAVLFVGAWAAGRLGLQWLVPGEDLLAQYILVVEFALVLTILTRVIQLSDEPSD